MPSFQDVLDGAPKIASNVQQIIDSWLGRSGKGVPLEQTSVNDETKYAGRFKNLDTVNGRIIRGDNADGQAVINVTKDGVALSPNGVDFGQTPAVLGLAQTWAAAQTFAGAIDHKYVASVASTAALTLPTTGNRFQITGTTSITSITAVAGALFTLIFNSGNCKVVKGSNLKLKQDFISVSQYDTLTIACDDGTNWYEVGRSVTPITIRYYLTAAQTIANNTETTIGTGGSAFSVDSEFPAVSGVTFTEASGVWTPPRVGWWRFTVCVDWADDTTKNRSLWLDKGSTLYRELSNMPTAVATEITVVHASDILYQDATSTFRFRVKHVAGAPLDIHGGAAHTAILWEFLGG